MLLLYTPLCRPSSGLVSSCASRRRGIDMRGAVYTTFQVVARLQSMAMALPIPAKVSAVAYTRNILCFIL